MPYSNKFVQHIISLVRFFWLKNSNEFQIKQEKEGKGSREEKRKKGRERKYRSRNKQLQVQQNTSVQRISLTLFTHVIARTVSCHSKPRSLIFPPNDFISGVMEVEDRIAGKRAPSFC